MEAQLDTHTHTQSVCCHSVQDPDDWHEKKNTEKLLTDQGLTFIRNHEVLTVNHTISKMSVDCMDITKGRLDDISRPASGSEIRRRSGERPGSLELLSPDLTHTQVQGSTHDLTAENSSDQEDSDEENEDPELGKAIRKMKRLDRILALKATAEREVKQKGMKQHQRLWQELQTVSLRMSSNEMENTRRFLALTPDNSQDCEEVDFISVFETEVLDLKYDTNMRQEMDEHTQVECVAHAEVGQQVMEDQTADGRRCGAARSKRRQDFVKKNIELVGASGNPVLLTQQERERIEELLKDLEEEQSDSDLLAEPQGSLEENTGDRVLWDMRQRREEERRLREIQQELQLLEETQQNSSFRLSDDQLRNLLLDCEDEIMRSPAGSSSETSLGMISALVASPCLSSSDLTEGTEHWNKA
ncbi:fibrous sheath-interacting protein 1-like isoform X5 [Ctenopharyngodon idella]|uniref:fibrous sheath-interacting protein 1-like isoform X5 n=1 Tax=Ctenopharyngodon idella TaxID=7959 RepID=UPI002231B140|nr:fibrous sheath-interacting protein 1-like isoform X5 [Ctenopharyngodon idella]